MEEVLAVAAAQESSVDATAVATLHGYNQSSKPEKCLYSQKIFHDMHHMYSFDKNVWHSFMNANKQNSNFSFLISHLCS